MEALNGRKSQLREQIRSTQAELAQLTKRSSELKGVISEVQGQTQALDRSIRNTDASHRQTDQRVLKRTSAKCVLDAVKVDAGMLTLHWDRLVFAGWRGNCTVQLAEITDCDSGASRIAARAGIPLIGTRWPGAELDGETLLLTLISGDGAPERVVLPGLPKGSEWNAELSQARNDRVMHEQDRQTSTAKSAAAASQKSNLEATVAETRGELRDVQARMASATTALRSSEQELALPDWEYRTVSVREKDAQKAIDRLLSSASADGWELVSTVSPKKGEIVVSLKRVRRV